MSEFAATRARDVLRALHRIGWRTKRQSDSHRTLERDGWTDFTLAFHDSEELGRAMLKRIARATGLRPEDF